MPQLRKIKFLVVKDGVTEEYSDIFDMAASVDIPGLPTKALEIKRHPEKIILENGYRIEVVPDIEIDPKMIERWTRLQKIFKTYNSRRYNKLNIELERWNNVYQFDDFNEVLKKVGVSERKFYEAMKKVRKFFCNGYYVKFSEESYKIVKRWIKIRKTFGVI